MALSDSLDEIRPGRNLSPVAYALTQLAEKEGEWEVKVWLEALDSELYVHRELAEVLTKHSGVAIRARQVTDYKRRRRESNGNS